MNGPAPITPAMAKAIELWPVERLVPYAKNARTHSDEQVAQIAASIAEFGFNNPVLVDTAAGIIAGHGRARGSKARIGAGPGGRARPSIRDAEAGFHHCG